ncbi:MAG: hypothetical protein WC421_11035 [Elusimicrobiales bacterium]
MLGKLIENENFMSIIFGYGVMIYALMFKEGLFSGKLNTRFRKVVALEKLFFGTISESVISEADSICFKIAILMSIAIMLNGFVSLFWPLVPNISLAFAIVAFPGVMVFRMVYILYRKQREQLRKN